MIQHLRISGSAVLENQFLKDLGGVNILTGRNSSGKTTSLKCIIDNPDCGYTFEISKKNKTNLINVFGSYIQPTISEIDILVTEFMQQINGKMLFTSSGAEIEEIVKKASIAVSFRYGIENDIKRIANLLTSPLLVNENILLLSPKRQMPYETVVENVLKLDTEAKVGLSRLFYLNNQVPNSKDKLLFERITESFYNITGSEFAIQIRTDQVASAIQLLFRRTGGSWIKAKNEGQGLIEIITILLYALDGKYKMVLIEEPESHIHPDFQRKLLAFLNEIEDRQFILSTHSPVFLNPTMVDRIYFCKFINGKIQINENTRRAEALIDIGVLAVDNLTSDAILITEGKTDQIVIDYILKNWLEAPFNASLSHVFLSGSMMVHFDPTPFSETRNTFALLDLDTSNTSAQNAFRSTCNNAGIIPFQLSRYSLENYYSLDAMRATFGELIPAQISLDNSVSIWVQFADLEHNENWWKGELKCFRRINLILKNMKLSDIETTDLFDFCKNIKSVL